MGGSKKQDEEMQESVFRGLRENGVQIELISYLNLSGCNIHEVKSGSFEGFRSLSHLDLSNNSIKDLSTLLDSTCLPVLWVLNASHNPLGVLGGRRRVLGSLDLRHTATLPTIDVTCFEMKHSAATFELHPSVLVLNDTVRQVPAPTHYYTKLLKRIGTVHRKAVKHVTHVLSWVQADPTAYPAKALHSLYTDIHLPGDDDPPNTDAPFYLSSWAARPEGAKDLLTLITYLLSKEPEEGWRAMLKAALAPITDKHDMHKHAVKSMSDLPLCALKAFKILLEAKLNTEASDETDATLRCHDMLVRYQVDRRVFVEGLLNADAARRAEMLEREKQDEQKARCYAEKMVNLRYAEELMARNERQYNVNRSLRLVKTGIDKVHDKMDDLPDPVPDPEPDPLTPATQCLYSIPEVRRARSASPAPAPYRKRDKAKLNSMPATLEGFGDDEKGILLSASQRPKHETLAANRQPTVGDLVVICDYIGRIAHVSSESVVYVQDETLGQGVGRCAKRDAMGRLVVAEGQQEKKVPLDLRSPVRIVRREHEEREEVPSPVLRRRQARYTLVHSSIMSWRPRVGWVVMRPSRPMVGDTVIDAGTVEEAVVTAVAPHEVTIQPLGCGTADTEVRLRAQDMVWHPGPRGHTWRVIEPAPEPVYEGNPVVSHSALSPVGDVMMDRKRWSEVRHGSHAFIVEDPEAPWHPFTEESLRRMAAKRKVMGRERVVKESHPMACSTAMMGARKAYAAGSTNQFLPSTIRTQVAAFIKNNQNTHTHTRPVKPRRRPHTATPTTEALTKANTTVQSILASRPSPPPAHDPTLFRVKW